MNHEYLICIYDCVNYNRSNINLEKIESNMRIATKEREQEIGNELGNWLSKVADIRNRPNILIASDFINKFPGHHNKIDITDVEKITLAINKIPEVETKIDVILHSHGGMIADARRIMDLLHARFEEVAVLVPHSAYSAATIMALSSNEIVLHPSASLSPVDPQIELADGTVVPANVAEKIMRSAQFNIYFSWLFKDNPYAGLTASEMISKPIRANNEHRYNRNTLYRYMLKYMYGAKIKINPHRFDFMNKVRIIMSKNRRKAKQVVSLFSDVETNILHTNPICYRDIQDYKLNVSTATGDLKNSLWEVYMWASAMFEECNYYKLYYCAGTWHWIAYPELCKDAQEVEKAD